MKNSVAPTCPGCSIEFNQTTSIPKIMGCGHTFCILCIHQGICQATGFECKICQKSKVLSRGELESLPTNHILLENDHLSSASTRISTHGKQSTSKSMFASSQTKSVASFQQGLPFSETKQSFQSLFPQRKEQRLHEVHDLPEKPLTRVMRFEEPRLFQSATKPISFFEEEPLRPKIENDVPFGKPNPQPFFSPQPSSSMFEKNEYGTDRK